MRRAYRITDQSALLQVAGQPRSNHSLVTALHCYRYSLKLWHKVELDSQSLEKHSVRSPLAQEALLSPSSFTPGISASFTFATPLLIRQHGHLSGHSFRHHSGIFRRISFSTSSLRFFDLTKLKHFKHAGLVRPRLAAVILVPGAVCETIRCALRFRSTLASDPTIETRGTGFRRNSVTSVKSVTCQAYNVRASLFL